MSSLSPFVSSPPPSASSSTSNRRLVKPLRRARDFDIERSRRAAALRGRKRHRQMRTVALSLALPVGAFALWMGARVRSAVFPVWPQGVSYAAGISSQNAPLAVGSSWFFVSDEGAVWRTGAKSAAPQKVWSGAFPVSPQVVGAPGGLVVAGGDGTLAFLDKQGRARWSAKSSGALSSRPAVIRSAGNTTIVGADDTGHLWARRASDGKALWRVNAGAPVGEGVAATPWGVVAPTLGSSTSRGGLRSFSAVDGKPLWKFPASPRERAAGTALPRFDTATNRLFWCNDQGTVFALDARTGRKLWKAFVSPRAGSRGVVVLRASPILADGVLVVGGNDGGLRAFDARDGHPLWTRWLDQSLSTPLGKARYNGRVVVTAGTKPLAFVGARDGRIVRQLGAGVVGWNGRDFAAADETGSWHFWAG